MDRRTSVYYRNANLSQITQEDYIYLIDTGMLYVYFPEATGIQKYDIPHTMTSRIDTIGQNGNDGIHYRVSGDDNPDGVNIELGENGWPHKYETGYAEKIEKLYGVSSEDLPKDNAFVDDYDPNAPCRRHDMVSNPKHYELGNTGVEAIDVIEAILTKEEYIGYLRGNILKYQLRANKKNGTEDLQKADMYSGWLIEALEGV